MSEDFEAGLRDLHDDAARAHARGAGFPTSALVGRARRNRRVRASASATLALVAVAAVAVGGLQLADRPPATPPAGTDGVPFISPTRCGDPSPVVEYRSSGPLGSVASNGDLYLQLGPIAPVPVGSALSVKAELVNGTDEMQSWSDAEGPARYLVVQDDVVVATGEFGPARSVSLWRGEILAWGVDDIELVSCGGDRAGEPLPAGFYALFVVYPLVLDDGREIELTVGSGFGITERRNDATPEPTAPVSPGQAMPLLAPNESRFVNDASKVPTSETSLEDGDYIGFLHSIDPVAGTVDFDIAIFYGGQAAMDWLAANDPTAENPAPNGYVIVNEVERVRTLPLAPGAVVWSWCYWSTGDSDFVGRTAAEWAAAPEGVAECDAGASMPRDPFRLYWFDVRGGVVQQVVGQYVP